MLCSDACRAFEKAGAEPQKKQKKKQAGKGPAAPRTPAAKAAASAAPKAKAKAKAGKREPASVEAVVGKRTSRAAGVEYCLKWAGRGAEAATWEPAASVPLVAIMRYEKVAAAVDAEEAHGKGVGKSKGAPKAAAAKPKRLPIGKCRAPLGAAVEVEFKGLGGFVGTVGRPSHSPGTLCAGLTSDRSTY